MSKISIDQLRSLPDYAQMTKWEITFVQLPVVGGLGLFITDQLNMRVESVEVPKMTNQKIEVQVRGHKTLHSGIVDYGNSITITFTETVDSFVAKFVSAWRNLCWSPRQGRAYSKKDLEATIMITQLDNQDKARYKHILYGCIWEADDFGSLDGSSSDIIRPSLTISFDFFVDSPL